MESFDIDDSEVQPPPRTPSRPFFAVLTFPIHLLSSILRFVLNFLRLPIRFSLYSSRHRTTLGRPDLWLRELEEETGAVSITTSTSTALEAPTTLTSRTRIPDDTKVLPAFTLTSYDDALRTAQREARIACIILVSQEHDDVPEFKRSTLTNPEFVRLLHDNNVVVWGGDVRDQEAHSAAEKLQATTYPFVAFLALQPKRAPSSSSSSSSSTPPAPILTILSRHSGSPRGPTSPSTLSTHLTTQLLPRVQPFLTRLHGIHAARERDRLLRIEQDAAFHATAARDRARIEGLMAEERAAADRARAEELEQEQQRVRAQEAERAKETQVAWRTWLRAVYAALPEGTSGSGVRIAVRLPSGGRLIRIFPADDTLTHLYAFVAGQLAPASSTSTLSPMSDPLPHTSPALESILSPHLSSSSSSSTTPPPFWGFLLVSAYPRHELPWAPSSPLSAIDVLKGGGQLVVEMLSAKSNGGGGNSKGKGREVVDADDEYETESDDDE
ncbi:hypothetical protein C0991_008105 [Blastosporella zonata]|nr:hypothetical protein C0991_008105 [Blastosporella zonata]